MDVAVAVPPESSNQKRKAQKTFADEEEARAAIDAADAFETAVLRLQMQNHAQADAKIKPKCLVCGKKKTPEWRTGPGKSTLCNADGARWSRHKTTREHARTFLSASP